MFDEYILGERYDAFFGFEFDQFDDNDENYETPDIDEPEF